MGAVTVGVTRLKDYHKYSVVGRGEKYGEPVELKHDYAIAFTVEMTKEMVDRAPLGPSVMESAQQYVEAGVPVFNSVERACKVLYKFTGYYRAIGHSA